MRLRVRTNAGAIRFAVRVHYALLISPVVSLSPSFSFSFAFPREISWPNIFLPSEASGREEMLSNILSGDNRLWDSGLLVKRAIPTGKGFRSFRPGGGPGRLPETVREMRVWWLKP